MLGWLHQGVGELIHQAGVQLMGLLMEAEVQERVASAAVGKRIERPRVRTAENQEVKLGS